MYRNLTLILLLLLAPQQTHAAEKYFRGYRFETSVVSNGGSAEESRWGSGNRLQVREGDEYSIVVHNPLPVRVAAAVSIDGLNSIDGKRSSPDEAQKWMIDPYSSITIKGWQTSDSGLRKFVFTRGRESYASWKSKRDRRNYTTNLGVIGVAYFWSSEELDSALRPPLPFSDDDRERGEVNFDRKAAAPASRSLEAAGRAGTGMGRQEWNPVTRVSFDYDTGMYSASDVLSIRYEFGEIRPQPFEEAHKYRYPDNFSPEMP